MPIEPILGGHSSYTTSNAALSRSTADAFAANPSRSHS